MLSKFGNLSIREILAVTSAYAHTSSRTDSGGGGGGGGGKSQDNPTGGGQCSAFGQPAFAYFLAKNHKTAVAFELADPFG